MNCSGRAASISTCNISSSSFGGPSRLSYSHDTGNGARCQPHGFETKRPPNSSSKSHPGSQVHRRPYKSPHVCSGLLLARVYTSSMPVSLATFSWPAVRCYCALNLYPSVFIYYALRSDAYDAQTSVCPAIHAFCGLILLFYALKSSQSHHLLAVLHTVSSRETRAKAHYSPQNVRIKDFH